MNGVRVSSLALPVLCSIPLSATSHHSPAMFDLGRDLVYEGKVTEVSWRNPHVYFAVEITGPDGEPVVRQIEAAPAGNLATLGMDATTLRPGDAVTVRVKPHRRLEDGVALGWVLMKSDGSAIPLHPLAAERSEPVTAQASSIAGTWVPRAADLAALAQTAPQWRLTDRGRALAAETAQARIAARSECVPFGPPMLMVLPAPMLVTVEDSRVTIKIDPLDTERVVHLNLSSHPEDIEPSIHGHSIGRWEGDTLVVDTIAYAAQPEGFAFDLPSSAGKHIVERFTLSADRRHIEYEAMVEDPEVLAEPVMHRSLWDYRPEQSPTGLPCDLESARRFATEE